MEQFDFFFRLQKVTNMADSMVLILFNAAEKALSEIRELSS